MWQATFTLIGSPPLALICLYAASGGNVAAGVSWHVILGYIKSHRVTILSQPVNLRQVVTTERTPYGIKQASTRLISQEWF
ncbi:hypothetical protein F5X99DRAFT_398584 [Biscogniauxia marginata]|nr:hypothetical protein F5X99DRAFT_398584 [Biscogniauxia marginata]